jgi:hypothetical protein
MEFAPLTAWVFYAAAVPAVLLAGVSKGGFGGGLGILAVPLMTLVVLPFQAAAIMLPILCAMDLIGVWAYRGRWSWPNLKILVPGAVVGIVLGALVYRYVTPAEIKLLIGVIAVAFALNRWLRPAARLAPAKGTNVAKGGFWGAVAGFVSFAAHAGGPPVNMYLLPQRLDKTVYQATTVLFFMVVNYVKLVPYALLGQFDAANLGTSLVLLPLVPLGMGLGIWAHSRVNETLFYRLAYIFLFMTGCKLIWDGIGAVFA